MRAGRLRDPEDNGRTSRAEWRALAGVFVAWVSLWCGPGVADEAAWSRYLQAGTAAYQRADYTAATQQLEAAVKEAETFGEQDPRLATSLNKLAVLYRTQARYAQAEPIFQRALAIREKAFGPEHPDVAQSLNDLAKVYYAQNRYSDAKPLYERALAIRAKLLGPEHPDIGQSLNDLGEVSFNQGRYSEAESLYDRALAMREKVLGLEHRDVAESLISLGDLYETQGKYAQAETLYQRALAIREKALGPEHPDVAESLNTLGGLYEIQGRYAQAEPLCRRSLAIREKTLGPEHPDVAHSLNNLASLYVDQRRYAQAEPLYQRALAISEKAFGPEHRSVAAALNNLGRLYDLRGQYAQAEPLFRRSLAIHEKALGPDHPIVATSLNNLAEVYRLQRRYTEAEPLYRRSLAIVEKALGPEHPDIAYGLNNLALLYHAQAKDAQAEPLYVRALAVREKALDPGHSLVAASLSNLAGFYYSQGRFAQAEPLLKRSLAIREKNLGPEDPLVAATIENLARAYRKLGRIAEAEPLEVRAARIRSARSPTTVAQGDSAGDLFAAARSNAVQEATRLLGTGADVNGRDARGATPLAWAAASGSREVAELLIARGADVNAKGPDDLTPLFLAIRSDSAKVVEFLIAHGAQVNARSKGAITPLMLAARNANRDIVELLIAQGADVNARDANGAPLLLFAFETAATTPSAERVLFGALSAVERARVLHDIARSKRQWREVARLLIDHGADVNATTSGGTTALFIAATLGDKGLVEALIAKGANLNPPIPPGVRAFESPLHAAIAERHKDVAELLINKGADVNARNMSARTSLHFLGAYIDDQELARLMVEHGADINATDKDGRTPLDHAKTAGNSHVADELVQRGARSGVVASAANSPPSEPMTLDGYLSLGMPPPDRLWTPADYEIAARVLLSIAQRNPGNLPKLGDPVSGPIFERLVSRNNFIHLKDKRAPIEFKAAALGSLLKIALPALPKIYVTYAVAANRGAASWTELVEIYGLMLHVIELTSASVAEFEEYAKELARTTQPSDADHRRATVMLEGAKLAHENAGAVAVSAVEALDDEHMRRAPKKDRTRLIQLTAESLPTILKLVPDDVRREVSAKVSSLIDKEPDEDLKFSLQRLAEGVAPHN